MDAIRRNIEATQALFAHGEPPAVIGTVSGSKAAQVFWQRHLDQAREALGAREALSFHEDLPVNQALGLLLLWKRLRPHLREGEGALSAFVFGEGTRAAPLTEAECGQKPAITSFVAVGEGQRRRYLSTVELALRYFAPVEHHLRRSGFDGVVVKWGDEVQIPTRDLRGVDPLFEGADVVRFVSVRPITDDDARNKDWVGVDEAGRVTAFIPRRPLSQMEALADRGLLQRREGQLWGGINLGSIAMSRVLLQALLEEFETEVDDPTADRKARPDLDPQFFTALTVAAIEDAQLRDEAWASACQGSPAIAKLEVAMPGLLGRLRSVLERFEAAHGRKVRMVAMDFGDQYWGDIGQHRQMYELYMALRDRGPAGAIARLLAGIEGEPDEHGNIVAGDTTLGANATVRDSVLLDAHVGAGDVRGCVLVGTRCGTLHAREAFDVHSTAVTMQLAEGSGAYKVVTASPVVARPGERITTVFLPDRELTMRVHEQTDLRARAANYEQPILGNEHSFAQVHELVTRAHPAKIGSRRDARSTEVWRSILESE